MNKNLWETIWDYDPNGLLVIDENYDIQIVNPAFVKMFNLSGFDLIGRKVSEFFDDIEDLVIVTNGEKEILKNIKVYEKYSLVTSNVIFKIEKNNLTVKIFHDITSQEKKEQELRLLKLKVLEDVQKIVDKQMKVGQEIASILGETTAETKSTMIKLLKILKQED